MAKPIADTFNDEPEGEQLTGGATLIDTDQDEVLRDAAVEMGAGDMETLAEKAAKLTEILGAAEVPDGVEVLEAPDIFKGLNEAQRAALGGALSDYTNRQTEALADEPEGEGVQIKEVTFADMPVFQNGTEVLHWAKENGLELSQAFPPNYSAALVVDTSGAHRTVPSKEITANDILECASRRRAPRKRVGRVWLDDFILDHDFGKARAFFAEIVPIRVEHRLDRQMLEVYGYSDQFDEIDPRYIVPEYVGEFTPDGVVFRKVPPRG